MKRKDRIKKKYFDFTKKSPTKQAEPETTTNKQESNSFYYKHYKMLAIIPIIILIIAIILISVQTATTGDFINKGISLKGGISVQVPTTNANIQELQEKLSSEFPENEISIRIIEESGEQAGITVESSILPEETQKTELFKQRISEITGVDEAEMSIQTIGATLGDAFFKQTMIALLIAFIFMSLVVFLYFKSFVPSMAVVLAAFSTITVTVAVLNIIDFKIGTAGIAALLMLIGYSVDTDIMLTTRVVKNKEGTVYQRIINAMKTGLTMTFTTMAAVTITLIVSKSDVLKEVMLILLIGLIMDLINTWLQNANILRIYMENKEKKEQEIA